MDGKASQSIVELFCKGQPVSQPRDTPRTILPSMADLSKAPRSTKPLWHWLRSNVKAATRGVPSEHRVHGWKESVKADFRLLGRQLGLSLIDYPIAVDLVFVMPRPKSKTRKGMNERYWHAKKPDFDNLTKAVVDALNEYAWRDDALIVESTQLLFVAGDGDRCGVAIRIRKPSAEIETWADDMVRDSKPSNLF